MIREEIRKLIERAAKEASFGLRAEIKIEHPANEALGDYSTNFALKIAKTVKISPKQIADHLKSHIFNLRSDLFERIAIVDPGFINFFVSRKYLQDRVAEILKQKNNFGSLSLGKQKKIQVEFISANPTGPLTVGNARGGPFGDTLSFVFEKAGFQVERAYYINDFGKQILDLGRSVLDPQAPDAVYKGAYINQIKEDAGIQKAIAEKNPHRLGRQASAIIIKWIKKTTLKMGIRYDEWFAESSLHKTPLFSKKSKVDEAIEVLEKRGLVYVGEGGAKFFKSSAYGDERDRVLVKSEAKQDAAMGTKELSKTYLAADIAYHRYKFEEKKFDKVINIWGADHYGDVAGLLAGVEALGHKGKLEMILLQFVTILERGEVMKMSKRKGVYVEMDQLLDSVGKDAVRFFFLEKSADTHLNFDLALAKEQSEKNPVYYVQYAHARICSILAKAKTQAKAGNLFLLTHPSELKLIKQLLRLPEIIEDTAKDYQTQRLPGYALDLAAAFHRFYHDCQVISENKKITQARLSLAAATKIVLKNTLDLMGISAPEKM